VYSKPTDGTLCLFLIGSHLLRTGANLWAHKIFFDYEKFSEFLF